MEPTKHVPHLVQPLDRRAFLGISLGSAAGLAAATAFSPAIARARQPVGAMPEKPGRTAHNVIFMVADGMSFGTLSLAEIASRAQHATGTNWVALWGREGAKRSVMRTASADSLVTDSSAGSSAWGGGVHINNDAVNFAPDGRLPVPILVHAAQNGKATGLVTTTRVTHATPAGFVANCPTRNSEDEIARQILDRRVDVVLGGGSKYFPDSLLATRPDLRVLRTRAAFDAEMNGMGDPASGPLLGVFQPSHCLYECERNEIDPSLSDMALMALRRLSSGKNGFVLQIEGGRVDHAAHANDAGTMVGEQLAFDRALGTVLQWMQNRDDTLLIVTTDHGNANPGLTLYGPETYKGIERLCSVRHSFEWIFEQLGMKLQYDDVTGRNKLSEEDRVGSVVREATGIQLVPDEIAAFVGSLKGKRPQLFEPMSRSSSILGSCLANHYGVGFISPNHTADFVEVTAIGPGSERIAPFIDNIDLHEVMLGALDLRPARAI
ncbi:MAG: alkaline phosphatase [Phycisphaeraceae bacterium]|nr:alkaline phosphatase [Phycisphaeraceae bacterium]